jgi:hypothetical protein
VHFSGIKAYERSSGVEISFTNLTESEVAYYEIERSVGGQPFRPINRITPVKNDYGSASYQWIDGSRFEGRISYRIKAVEITGKAIYSEVVSISPSTHNEGFNVFAKGGQVKLQIGNLPAGQYLFRILNASGQLVNIESISHGGGAISQSIPLNNIKTGVYIFSVNGPVKMQKKFLLQ